MCEKCNELDKKIEHYKAIQSRVTDRTTLDGIAELIAQLLARKADLHPETKQ
ncbi:MAG: hypothetical protein JHD07_04325 [Bradyrhizobium sp.]|jgi:hypothetical protein|uniref:hypothetical protein n=1 Tax=Bradyrhizobium TaxID=374 RepID=UPI0003FB5C68|nr:MULTISPECIES: hypothetical protein [Bradyrhizobium]MBJ7402547.1 hypothetical protein [Bradyrhizobium sp.]